MTHNVLVDKSMQGTRVRTAHTAALGDNKRVVEVVPLEFRSLIPYYPIVLSKDAARSQYLFVALLGFEPGENLLLEGDTWSVPYIPVNIRRQPFNVIAAEGSRKWSATANAGLEH
ncbi:MAG: SapC family protein [Gammaproteobacteria bacterium]|nr:SapC family protein [Gammaproteobacteria bacterium]